METLKEIMRVVTLKADVKKVFPELTDDESPQSITATYVRGIIDNVYDDDDAAAKDLYGKDRTDQRYRTLKSRIYDRLLAALLNLQVKQPEHSLYLTMYYKCSRNTVAAQTLMRFAARRSGVQLAERTLHSADKFHFTDLQIALTYSLRTSMALLRNKRQYDLYHSRLIQLLDIQRAEFESDYLIDQTLLPERKRTKEFNNAGEFHSIITKAKELRDKYSTNTLNLNYFRLKSSLHEASFQYDELIEVCDEALSYFNTYPHFSLPARVGEFSLMKAIASSSMRHFHTANEMAQVCIQCFTRGGNNWYLALDIGYTSAMNEKDYVRAIEYHELAINDPRFATLPRLMQERWTTYTAYLYLAKELGFISNCATDFSRKFRLASFLNSVPEFSKDKKYSNFLVIVSHICFLLIQDKHDDAERRAEYLRTYGLRYLKEDEFKRARVFIKILLFLAKGINTDVYKDHSYTSLFEELRSSIHTTRGNEVNEIIPYELLTERLVSRILEKRNKV